MFDIELKISSHYESLRKTAQLDCENYFKLAESNERFVYLRLKLNKLKLAKSKAEYSKDFTMLECLSSDILATEKEMNSILIKLNLNINMFEPNYKCKLCNDTGVIDGSDCSCKQEIYKKVLSESLFAGRKIYPDFKNAIIDDKNKQVIEVAKLFCEKFPQTNTKNLIFSGKTGTGKTFIAECIANDLINKGNTVLFFSAFTLISKIRELHFSFTKSINEFLEKVYLCELLIIDDLGCEAIIRNITEEYLLNILNERVSASKHTLFTTNLNEDELIEKYGERFFARLTAKNNSAFFVFDSLNNMRNFI